MLILIETSTTSSPLTMAVPPPTIASNAQAKIGTSSPFFSRKDQRLTQQQFSSLLTMFPALSLFRIEICDHLELDGIHNLGQIKQILSLERGHYQCHGIGASQMKFVQYLCRKSRRSDARTGGATTPPPSSRSRLPRLVDVVH